MTFADRFSSRMSDGYDQLATSSASMAAKDLALNRKVGNVTAAFINAVEESPVVGLIDMLVMVTLVRQSSEDPWFAEMYGEDSARIVALLKVQEEDIWRIGSRYLTQGQLAELREAIDRWRRDHPDQRYVAMVRLSDFADAKSTSAASTKAPGSVFGLLFLDPLSGLDPAIAEMERSRETAERMFFYLQRMPTLLSWQSESVSRRILGAPELRQFIDNTSSFSVSTSRFADSTKSVADCVGRFPQYLTEERQKTVEQLAQAVAIEREAAIRQLNDAVAAQRDAAVQQIAEAVAVERKQIMHSATTRVASEREATIKQMDVSVQMQREGLVHDIESATARSINRVFVLACVVVALGVGSTVSAVLILRFHARNSRLRLKTWKAAERTSVRARRSDGDQHGCTDTNSPMSSGR